MGVKIVEYKATVVPGVTFPTKSFIIEENENLLIISPCSFEDSVIESLKSSNKKLIFIAPNNFHNMHLKKMKRLFPEAQFYGPGRAAKQSGVDLQDTNLLEAQDVEAIFIEGCSPLKETCFYHSPTKTLLVTDLFFNMQHSMGLMTKILLKLTGTYHKLSTSKIVLKSIDDKQKFKLSLERLKGLDINKVIPSHGDSIDKDSFIKWADSF